MKNQLFSRASMLAIGLAVVVTTPALAQTPEPDSGDIVVTATRQSSLLSKTPIAITAVTNEGLRDAGITDARSLADAVPNLAISENGDAVRISIRGVTSTDTTEKGDPSAAFLLDGVYIARAADTLGSFYDLERVEVLRGPQGTLYGRNTTAGVINVIAARPSNKFEAAVDGRYGNLESIGAQGMVNVPVGDALGLRAAVNFDRQNAVVLKGPASPIPLNPFRDVLAGRLSFGGELGDNFKFVIRGDYAQSKGTLTNSVPLSKFFPTLPATPGIDPIYVDIGSTAQRTLPYAEAFTNRRNNKNYGIMGEFTYEFGSASLTYLGSYRKTERNDNRNLLIFGALNNPAFFFGKFDQQSHELRLAFGQGNPLHGQVGAYYFREKSALEFNLGAPLSGFVVPNATGFAFPQGPTIASSKAGFAQLTYDLTPDLHLTGGIRYTSDLKSRNGATVVDFPTLAVSICGKLRCVLNENIAKRTFTKTTWKLGIDYDAPGLGLFYGSVSTGYKAGGFNDGCITGGGTGCSLTAAQLYYEPETLTSYEVGYKLKLLDNALRLNVSAFHYDYKNLQLSQIATVGGVPGTLTQNAGSAKVDGVEIEAIITPSDNDRVVFSMNSTNARYDNFIPQLASGAKRNFKGLLLDHAPRFIGIAGYTHTFPLGNGGGIEAGVQTRVSSAYFMQDLTILAQYRQPAYSKTDLTLTYKAPEDRWYVQAFGKNLENVITLAAASSGLAASATIEEPRTYGVRAGFKF